MLKSLVVLLALFNGLIVAQLNIIDDRYGNRLPAPQPPPSPYYNMGYNVNVPSNIPVSTNNNNNNNNDGGVVDEFGQCGGLDWEGPQTCRGGLICFKRSKYYSQCISSDAAVVATRPSPPVVPAGSKCHGGTIRGPFACAIGTACFIQTENVHGECKTHCPQGWFCNKQTLPEWAPCGGEGYVGLTKCKDGLHCFTHSRWYHECRSDCPEGWKC